MATTFGCESLATACASRAEACRLDVVGARVGPQDLDGDLAIQLRIVRGVDLAHPAAADQAQEAVASDRQLAGRRPRLAPPTAAGAATATSVAQAGQSTRWRSTAASAGPRSAPFTNATTVSSSRQSMVGRAIIAERGARTREAALAPPSVW